MKTLTNLSGFSKERMSRVPRDRALYRLLSKRISDHVETCAFLVHVSYEPASKALMALGLVFLIKTS